MQIKNPVLHSLGHAVLVGLYVLGVATLMTNLEKNLPDGKSVLVPVGMLMLFVLSAAITGALVLGRPIFMYMDGQKKEALKFFGLTLGWMFVIILTVFLFMFAGK